MEIFRSCEYVVGLCMFERRFRGILYWVIFIIEIVLGLTLLFFSFVCFVENVNVFKVEGLRYK